MAEISHYLKRVAPEHKKPKFMKWLEANLMPFKQIMDTIYNIDTSFDLDYSVGLQLDVTGDIVGIKRLLGFEPPLGLSPLLEDDMYRILQRAKISLNQWDGTLPTAHALLEGMFPQYKFLLYDNQNMTISVHITGEPSIIEREIISHGYITPKPEGVRVVYEFILPAIRCEAKLYTGGIVSTDSARMKIPLKALENMELSSKYYIKSAIGYDVSRIIIPTKALE